MKEELKRLTRAFKYFLWFISRCIALWLAAAFIFFSLSILLLCYVGNSMNFETRLEAIKWMCENPGKEVYFNHPEYTYAIPYASLTKEGH